MTLREAAARTGRSITTLRRYIRSGRLRAEKRYGRFGPEYFVSERDLGSAGLDTTAAEGPTGLAPTRDKKREIARVRRSGDVDGVPLVLFQDLQMKHEQLLVQYGMIRSAGLRVMELQADLESARQRLQEAREEVGRLQRRIGRESSELERQGREGRLELEAKDLENAALREKVRTLELLTRNAVTTETIENQFARVMEQSRRVEELSDEPRRSIGQPWRSDPHAEPPDH